MDTHEAIRRRRSVKHYDPDFVIPDNHIQTLLELALLSPTSFNMQNWRFVIVQDPHKRKLIREAAWNQSQVTDSSLLFLLCADLKSWNKNPAQYWKNAEKEVQETVVPMIDTFYKDQGLLERDEAMRSVGITAQTLMLAAKSMGYDSCPMIGYDEKEVGQIINLPDDHLIGMMLVVGKASSPAYPRSGQLSIDDVVITDSF